MPAFEKVQEPTSVTCRRRRSGLTSSVTWPRSPTSATPRHRNKDRNAPCPISTCRHGICRYSRHLDSRVPHCAWHMGDRRLDVGWRRQKRRDQNDPFSTGSDSCTASIRDFIRSLRQQLRTVSPVDFVNSHGYRGPASCDTVNEGRRCRIPYISWYLDISVAGEQCGAHRHWAGDSETEK